MLADESGELESALLSEGAATCCDTWARANHTIVDEVAYVKSDKEARDASNTAACVASSSYGSASVSVGSAGGRTLSHMLARWSVERAAEPALRWLDDAGGLARTLSYSQLYAGARRVAWHLVHAWAVQPGELALLVYPPGVHFAVAFLGCLHAGVVAVPAPPPDPADARQGLRKLAALVRAAGPKLALTEAAFSAPIRLLSRQYGSGTCSTLGGSTEGALTGATEGRPIEGGSINEGSTSILSKLVWQSTDRLEERPPPQGREDDDAPSCRLEDDSHAFVQFTSGSTGQPKGALVSHRRLVANLEQMRERCCDGTFEIRGCSWLPHHHDMGLVGNLLLPVWVGAQVTRPNYPDPHSLSLRQPV